MNDLKNITEDISSRHLNKLAKTAAIIKMVSLRGGSSSKPLASSIDQLTSSVAAVSLKDTQEDNKPVL
jgi:hypothetical protein